MKQVVYYCDKCYATRDINTIRFFNIKEKHYDFCEKCFKGASELRKEYKNKLTKDIIENFICTLDF